MAFSQQEQDIIKFGAANGKTREQVEQAISNMRSGIVPQPQAEAPKEASYLERVKEKVGTDINQRVGRYGDIQTREKGVTKAVQSFGQGAGMAANAIETVVGEAPGVKQGFEKVGEGINWLATSELSPLKHLGDLIGGTKTVQEMVNLYDTDQGFKDSVDGVANIVRLGGDVQAAIDGVNFASNVTQKVVTKLKPDIANITPATAMAQGFKGKVGAMVDTSPADIMQRVARISKGKQAKFEEMAGQSIGEYLTERGNFGNIEKISENLYKTYTNSMKEVDAALEKLPGTYEPQQVKTALSEVVARETRVSSPGATSPDLARATQLLNKIKHEGLTMAEINESKRLFERVYTDALKVTGSNPEAAVRAKVLDQAIRSWQFKQADTLGFKNLGEMNRETRLARQLLDDIGTEYAGSAGNNAITLTDWIMLSGADPTAIGGFLAKKTFSSKDVQAYIAEWMNKGKEVKGPVKPDLGPSEVRQLPSPKDGAPQVGINTPIQIPPKLGMGTEVVTPSMRLSPQGLEKLESTLPNSTPKTRNMESGMINYAAMADDIKASIIQLKKLTSASFNKGKTVDMEGFGMWEELVNKDPKKWTKNDILTANELLRLYSK